jgi:hypothetical protein
MNDPEVVVLIAHDAAGEGVNLQRAHLMINCVASTARFSCLLFPPKPLRPLLLHFLDVIRFPGLVEKGLCR